ncbi:Zn-dependent protease with chaperone function [Pullulanibacillus pueri]|uniref:Cell surface protein n=1 Tax=Pullulanibacillus pueri TaxID=1437324 RepID=A0A8J2ZW18_9BACL|nr:M56 family metallopeptidase [Pullulanibacillus pueri]MBM7682627.1 Zn-dependent protease with chaperone function [Pullulanibacillus pueri]GGH82565.1 cell surface protein [Pullulanibacillus pueri]
MWQKKSLYLFGSGLVMAGIVWSQMGMYLLHIFFGVRLHVNLFEFCIGLVMKDSIYYFCILLVINAWITYSFLIMVISTGRYFYFFRRLQRKLSQLQNINITEQVSRRYQLKCEAILIINHNDPLAFTCGLRRPRMVMSTGLLTLLDELELEAVLKHERFHQKNHDPMKLFILQLISKSLWFLPLQKWLYQNYKIVCELSADEFAIKKTGSELGLSTALLKLIKNGFHKQPAPVLVHFSVESVNYRLQHLINPKQGIPLKLKAHSLILSLLIILIEMILVAVI